MASESVGHFCMAWGSCAYCAFCGKEMPIATHPQSPASPLPEAAEPVATILRGGTKVFGGACVLQRWEAGAELLPNGEHKLYAAPSPVAQAPAQAGEVVRLAQEAKHEAREAAECVYAENAAPHLARMDTVIDRLAALATQPLAAPVQQEAEAVTVSVEEMVESVNGVSWWVVIRRGKHRQDDGKYGADFKNRAEWHAAGLRWILGQSDKPNIRDFMDATPPAQPVLAPVVREPLSDEHWMHKAHEFQAERDDLRHLLDSRPALNAGLAEAYRDWTGKVYAAEMVRAAFAHGIQATTGEQSHG